MTKKHYEHPVASVFPFESEPLLSESVTDVRTKGLDEGEKLEYDDTAAPSSVWDDAR